MLMHSFIVDSDEGDQCDCEDHREDSNIHGLSVQTKGDEDEDHQQDNLHRQGNLNPDLEIVAE